MTWFFKRLWQQRGPVSTKRDLPRTFVPTSHDRRVDRPKVFEPALLHYTHAFRLGEPKFSNVSLAQPWRDARRRVMDHVLRLVGNSPWSDHLVLRGSLLMKAWLGDAAREPGDIDWTVTPRTKLISEPWASELFDGIVRLVGTQPRVGDSIEILVDRIATDDIWTYDRAPGRRIVFPWTAEGLPDGTVQMDIVFGEAIDPPPTRTFIPACDGSAGGEVWSASRVQSLAWKILWLETDVYPQGKDLYDAVILAEHTPAVPRELIERTLRSSPDYRPPEVPLEDLPLRWDVDWDNFKLEYPSVIGDSMAWKQRLAAALRKALIEVDHQRA